DQAVRTGSFAAFLHVGADEVVGVLLENIVDVVEEVVGVVHSGVRVLLAGLAARDRVVIVIVAAAGALGLFLCHCAPPLLVRYPGHAGRLRDPAGDRLYLTLPTRVGARARPHPPALRRPCRGGAGGRSGDADARGASTRSR